MRLAAALVFLVVAFPAAAQHEAHLPPAAPQELIKQWGRQNEVCRGESNPQVFQPACERREIVQKRLVAAGWCYGRRGEAGAQFQWHRCGPGSYR